VRHLHFKKALIDSVVVKGLDHLAREGWVLDGLRDRFARQLGQLGNDRHHDGDNELPSFKGWKTLIFWGRGGVGGEKSR
jgi:hypothetical protein